MARRIRSQSAFADSAGRMPNKMTAPKAAIASATLVLTK